MKRTLWVCNSKGGVGKTVVSTLIVDAIRDAGGAVVAIDADVATKHAPEAAMSTNLSAVFADAVRFEIAPSAEALLEEPTLALSHWDELDTELLQHPLTVVDFGANVIDSALHWMRMSDVAERWSECGLRLDLVVVTTASPDGMRGAVEALEEAETIVGKNTDVLRRWVVLNHAAGAFASYANTPEHRRMQALDDVGTINVGRCKSEIWGHVERARLSASRVGKMDLQQIMSMTGAGELACRRGRRYLGDWYDEAVGQMRGAGLLDNVEPAASPAPGRRGKAENAADQ